MVSRDFVIKFDGKFDAKKLAKILNELKHFDSDVYIEYEESTVNIKSIMDVLLLDIQSDSTVAFKTLGRHNFDVLHFLDDYLQQSL